MHAAPWVQLKFGVVNHLDPQIVPTVLAAVVMLATVLWAQVSRIRNRPRRPSTGPATMELGSESPALVDLITDDFTVTPEAVPATLVDLAARRRLEIEEVAGGNVIIRLRSGDGDGALAPHERRVLDHVRNLAVDGVVPAAATTTGPEGASKNWWRAFRREVIADAHDRGLCRDRWTRADLASIWAGVIGAGFLVWLAAELGGGGDDPSAPGAVGWLWALTLIGTAGLGFWVLTLPRRDLQRDTDAGLAAAGRWLGVREYMATIGDFESTPVASVAVWDRHLAYAVALDLAPVVVSQLPLGAEDYRHAWSSATGRWRPVRVHYPWLHPGYGQHPALAALGATVAGALAIVVLRFAVRVRGDEIDALTDVTGSAARGIDIATMVVGAVALVVLVWNVVKLVSALADLAGRDHQEGVLIRRRVRHGLVGLAEERSTSSEDRAKERFFCAFDTGDGSEVTAWRVRRAIYDQTRQGDSYRVEVTPRLRYVRQVTPA